MMWTYVGVIAFIVLWIIAGIALDRPEFEKGAALWEPLGTGAYGLITKYWTATERNTVTPPLAGVLLWNRVFCLTLAGAFLTAAYWLFSLQPAELSGNRKVKKAKAGAGEADALRPRRARWLPPL